MFSAWLKCVTIYPEDFVDNVVMPSGNLQCSILAFGQMHAKLFKYQIGHMSNARNCMGVIGRSPTCCRKELG